MSKEIDCNELDIANLQNELTDAKKKIDTLAGQNTGLTQKLTEAEKTVKSTSDALNAYKEAERKALIDSIVQRSEFKADELKDKPVEELRTIHTTIDRVKPNGTVKNVRGAGDGNSFPHHFTPDGKVDVTKSLLGVPKKGADGRVMRDSAGNVIWEVK